MYSGEREILSEDAFLTEITPFFEEAKAELYAVLLPSSSWKTFLLKLHLIYVDNSSFGRESYFGLSNTLTRSTFLTNSGPSAEMSYVDGHYMAVLKELAAVYVMDKLRSAVVEELLSLATPLQLCEYLEQVLCHHYRSLNKWDCKDAGYIYLLFTNMSLDHDIFAITAYNTHIFIPYSNELDLKNIKLEDDGEDDIKIVFTNKKITKTYKNFHRVLGIKELRNHFCDTSFSSFSRISLYKKILNKPYTNVFKIINLLKTRSNYDIYEMMEKLVTLEFSNGNEFEAFLEQFLTWTFKSLFYNFQLNIQKPNEDNDRIRDFIIVNSESRSHFLNSLRKRDKSDQLLFDAKNYHEELHTRDLDTFRSYIRENRFFGNFGIILSRKGASETCLRHITKYLLSRAGTKIVILDEEDLLSMLSYVDAGRDPVEIIETKYYEMLQRL